MRKFQWEKIPRTKTSTGKNVWTLAEKQSSGCKLDFSRVEELFSVVTGQSQFAARRSRRTEDTSSLSKEGKPGELLNLLDSRRSLNLNIFLRQFRSSQEDLLRSLANGEADKWDAEKLRSLVKCLPEEEEMKQLEEFKGDRSRLGCAERFCVELASISNYRVRIEAMLLKEEFIHSIDWLKASIDAVIITARDLKQSRLIRDLLHCVLTLGNFLNAGGYAGEAAGFRLTSLLTLGDFRANNSRISLLHVVVMEAEKNNLDVTKFHTELKYLKEAAQWSVETIRSDVQSLQEKHARVKELLEKTDAQFKQQMGRFIEYANGEVCTLAQDLAELESLRLEMAEYFCEDVKSFQLDECIRTFNSFVDMLLKAKQENRERTLLEEKAEQRKRLRDAQINAKRNSFTGTGPDRKQTSGRDTTKGLTTSVENSPNSLKESVSLAKEGLPRNLSDTSLFHRFSGSKTTTDDTTGNLPDGAHGKRHQGDNHSFKNEGEDSCITPCTSHDRTPLSREGSFNRKRRSRESMGEDDLFNYLVQSRESSASFDLGDGSQSLRQQRRRRPINVETARERIFTPLNNIVAGLGDINSSPLATPTTNSRTLDTAEPCELRNASKLGSLTQDDPIHCSDNITRNSLNAVGQSIHQYAPSCNSIDTTMQDFSRASSLWSSPLLESTNLDRIGNFSNRCNVNKPVHPDEADCVHDSSSTESFNNLTLSKLPISASGGDGSIRLSCSPHTNPLANTENGTICNDSTYNVSPNNAEPCTTNAFVNYKGSVDQILYEYNPDTSRDCTLVYTGQMTSAKQNLGLSNESRELCRSDQQFAQNSLELDAEKAKVAGSNILSVESHTSNAVSLKTGSSGTNEGTQDPMCSKISKERKDFTKAEVDKRLNTVHGLFNRGNYECSSLDRYNLKKRSGLTMIARDRSLDDAVVPSSTLRLKQESEKLDLNLQDFQSKPKDVRREETINKLKRLSAIYSPNKGDENDDQSTSGRRWNALGCGIKQTFCVGSSHSSLENSTGRSNTSLIEEEEIRFRNKLLDRDSKSKDEGFESESLSDPNTSSQRSSMYSTGDIEPSTESDQPCGSNIKKETSLESEDATAGTAPGCGAKYFSRSIDSIVVKAELTPVEVDFEEFPAVSPDERTLTPPVEHSNERLLVDCSVIDVESTSNVSKETVTPDNKSQVPRRTSSGSKLPVKPSKHLSSASKVTDRLHPSKPVAKRMSMSSFCTTKRLNSSLGPFKKATTLIKPTERPKKPSVSAHSAVDHTTSRGAAAASNTPTKQNSRSTSLPHTSKRSTMQGFVRGSSPRTAISPPALRNNKKAAAENRSSKLPQSPRVSADAPPSPGRNALLRSAPSSPAKKSPAVVSQNSRHSKLPVGSGYMRDTACSSAREKIANVTRTDHGNVGTQSSRLQPPGAKPR